MTQQATASLTTAQYLQVKKQIALVLAVVEAIPLDAFQATPPRLADVPGLVGVVEALRALQKAAAEVKLP